MGKEYVLVLGGDLVNDGRELGEMTKNRINFAIAYAKDHEDAEFFAAAGICPEYPETEAMGVMMVEMLRRHEVNGTFIGPDSDFNTRGEIRVFNGCVPKDGRKKVISAWWHIPRVKRIIKQVCEREVVRTFAYERSDEKLTPRLAFLESIKWGLTFLPEYIRNPLVNFYRKLFGRSSW